MGGAETASDGRRASTEQKTLGKAALFLSIALDGFWRGVGLSRGVSEIFEREARYARHGERCAITIQFAAISQVETLATGLW